MGVYCIVPLLNLIPSRTTAVILSKAKHSCNRPEHFKKQCSLSATKMAFWLHATCAQGLIPEIQTRRNPRRETPENLNGQPLVAWPLPPQLASTWQYSLIFNPAFIKGRQQNTWKPDDRKAVNWDTHKQKHSLWAVRPSDMKVCFAAFLPVHV